MAEKKDSIKKPKTKKTAKATTGQKKIAGRQKGTANILTTTTKDNIKTLIEHLNNKIIKEKDIEALTPKERIDAYIKLAQFIVPKAQPDIDIPTEVTKKTISMKRITEAILITTETK